ncbi:MAG: FUN14 domain-containing protein [Candidatus Bathyarchaeia archaeon]|jgi:uncharacterized membrane protein (Fun14 family)
MMITSSFADSLVPILFQLAIGGIGGFLVGYIIRRVLKLALVIVLFVFSLLLLAYLNVINVNYGTLADAATNIVTAINPAFSMLAPLLANLPFIASFVLGLFLGFTRE